MGKSKDMMVEREGESMCNVQVEVKKLEVVEESEYLGVRVDKGGNCGKEAQ